MAKTARRYDIYLPITFNDDRPIPDELFDAVERRLITQFGGVTAQQRDFPLRGARRDAIVSRSGHRHDDTRFPAA
jgi:hypothetical protein